MPPVALRPTRPTANLNLYPVGTFIPNPTESDIPHTLTPERRRLLLKLAEQTFPEVQDPPGAVRLGCSQCLHQLDSRRA